MIDDKLINRVKNLLDMAKDASSPNEALIAAKRARAMMDKYQISNEDILQHNEETDKFLTRHASKSYARKVTWVSIMAMGVGRLNDCIPVIRTKGGRVNYTYNGFASDAIIAGYTHDYLLDTCDRLLRWSGVKGRANCNFYRLGFAGEVCDRIAEIMHERENISVSGGRGLVVVKKALVSAHFGEFSKGRAVRTRTPSADEHSAMQKGAEDAKSVQFNAQVSGSGTLRLTK